MRKAWHPGTRACEEWSVALALFLVLILAVGGYLRLSHINWDAGRISIRMSAS
jgi:hypothetical protein